MDYEEEYEIENNIWKAVHDLVDEMLKDVPTESQENIRKRLTETFRFWKRL